MFKKLRTMIAAWWGSSWFNESDQPTTAEMELDEYLDHNRKIRGFAERNGEIHGR